MDVVDRVTHRLQILEILVFDAEADGPFGQLLLQRLHQLDQSQGMDSYLHSMHELMRGVGRLSGGRFEFAEGWRQHLHLGFCAAEADPLAEALGSAAFRVAD